jgi:hypothetical protein
MNLQRDTLGNKLTTHQIQLGWETYIKEYPNRPLWCMDARDCKFRTVSILTLTQTESIHL